MEETTVAADDTTLETPGRVSPSDESNNRNQDVLALSFDQNSTDGLSADGLSASSSAGFSTPGRGTGGQQRQFHPPDRGLEVGTTVWVRRRGKPLLEGEVAYLGTVKFAPGDDWVGVRLSEHLAAHGKNDGSVDDIQYFPTSSPTQGLFVRRSALRVKRTTAHDPADGVTTHYRADGVPSPAAARATTVAQSPGVLQLKTGDTAAFTTTPLSTPPPQVTKMSRTPVDTPKTASATRVTKKSVESKWAQPSPALQQKIFRTPISKQRRQQEVENAAPAPDSSIALSDSDALVITPNNRNATASKENEEQRRQRKLQDWRLNSGRRPSPQGGESSPAAVAYGDSSPTSSEQQRQNDTLLLEENPTVQASLAVASAVASPPAAMAAVSGAVVALSDPQELAEFAQSLSPSPTRKNHRQQPVSTSLGARFHRGIVEHEEHDDDDHHHHNNNGHDNVLHEESSGSWLHALMCTILLFSSLVPATLLAVSLLVPQWFPHAAIVPHNNNNNNNNGSSNDGDWFLSRFTAGLLLGQVGTSVVLLSPMLFSGIFCCGGGGRTILIWSTARIAGLISAWMGLLSLVLTLWLLSSSSNKSEETANGYNHHDGELIILLGGSAGTLILATLGLALSFWPSQNTSKHSCSGPHNMSRRNQYPVINTVATSTGGTQQTEQQQENGLLEPLLAGGHPDDDVEAGIGSAAAAEANVASAAGGETGQSQEGEEGTTGRVRGTRRLLQLASSQVLYLYIGCFVLLIRLPFSLAIPHFVSTTLAALGHGDYHQARLEVLYLFVMGSIDAALDFWCVFLFGYANLRIVKGVRVDLFQRLLRMEVAFFDRNNTGTLASRLNSDCSEMAGDLTWFFRFSIESVVRITGITAYMLIRSPRLGACALSIIPVVGVINKFYGDWLRKNAIAVQDALAEANAVAQEALSNVRTVIAFAAEDLESEYYRDKIEQQYKLNLKQLFMTGVYYMAVSTFLINTVVQAALLFYGAFLIEHSRLTSDVLLAFMLYQGQLQQETLNLFQSYSSLIKSSGAGDKVFGLLDRRPPPPATGSDELAAVADETEPVSYDLSLQHVSFAYPTRPTQHVLKKMVLDIPQGSTVALVGPSGCGKTTVINLLQRFYDPLEGSIMLNGRDLRSYDLQEHRRRIGVVSQDCILFDGSILENITYGTHQRGGAIEDPVTLQDVRRAAALAHADVFIEAMPQGYHTVVGEKGVQLSGGQRQRISIARAIFQRPLLLILDEATSALDRESEQVVQEALDDLLQRQREKPAPGYSANGATPSSGSTVVSSTTTTVVIAHRLHTVQNADFIAVLSEGQVAEFGSPEALILRPNSLYRQLVDRAAATGRIEDS